MCKSIRNEIVDTANLELLAYVTEEDANERFIPNGFCMGVSKDDKIQMTIQGKSPDMSLSVKISDKKNDKAYLCIGSSRLKEGDEWSGYEGFKICCLRAARHYSEHVLKEQIAMIEFYDDMADKFTELASIVEQTYFGVECK